MIKIAFIMLCHAYPSVINQLITKLSEFSQADSYIHVDLNCPEIREQIKQRENTFVLPEEKSFHLQWGSVDLVKATLQMIREVRKSGKAYDYIWLISGQDYPIIPIKEIERRLSKYSNMNYIDTLMPGNKHYTWKKKMYEVAYPAWMNADRAPIKALKGLYKILTGGFRHTFEIVRRKKPFDFDFVFGSQWWTLTSKAAFDILQYSDSHPEVLAYYEQSIIPDESFFQTLFMRGPYKEYRSGSLTYTYWGEDPRHPKTLTAEDFGLIREARNSFCFARKMNNESQSLIRLIEQENGGTPDDAGGSEAPDNYK